MSKRILTLFAIILVALTVLSVTACVKDGVETESTSSADSESITAPEFIATIPPEELDYPVEETTAAGQE